MQNTDKHQQAQQAHVIDIKELCSMLQTDTLTGITNTLAVERNKLEGDNRLPQRQKPHPVILFLKEITNWFAILLWVGCFLSIVIYIYEPEGNQANLFLAMSLMVVILITGSITFLQTAKSQQIMQKFKEMLPLRCKVIRQGKVLHIQAISLVRGDLVQIENGERIPADLRIIQSKQMKVDNSSITGQTNLMLRTTECTSNDLLITKNIAFFGTYCKQGRGKGIVIKIADNTFMGSIANASFGKIKQNSPLQDQLDRFVLMITVIACSLGMLFIVLSYLVVGYTMLDCMVFGIGIIVANVPEGILACVTISLAITAKKLAGKNVLVKNLESVETLGSTSCICSDKTGTLTMNKMTVNHIWLEGKLQNYGEEISKIKAKQKYSGDATFRMLMDAAVLSSTAKFQHSQNALLFSDQIQRANVFGDASETALVKFVQHFQDIKQLRQVKYKCAINIDEHPFFHHFDSIKKYSFGIAKDIKTNKSNKYIILMKGAPQKIWKLCTQIRINNESKPVNTYWDEQFKRVNEELGSAGERVLGFAYKELDQSQFHDSFRFIEETQHNRPNYDLQNMTFLGLISLIDPPKPTVYEAIRKCRASGVKVIMLTGDQSTTAISIAKKIGIISLKTNLDFVKQGWSKAQAINMAHAVSINGALIEQAYQLGSDYGDQILQNWLKKHEVVFSRTTPLHKLRIVEACQRLGYIVGVTGDGVNDAPAIKQANIGISMGLSGSDVTKDAADMILLDDDFSSIVEGIQQGRKVFDNLKKTIMYLLTSNATQIWPFLVMVLIQIPLPISNIFMLCICVGTDIYPAISLAYEQPELDIMTRKPRRSTDRLVSSRMMVHSYGLMGSIASAAGFFTYFVIMQLYGFTPTILFNLLSKKGMVPNDEFGDTDTSFNRIIMYDEAASDLGNPFLPLNCQNGIKSSKFPNWLKFTNNRYDLRAAYLQCCPPPNQQLYCSMFNWPQSYLPTISPITNSQVAFTTQALFYAQSGYFSAIVLVQWSNIFACKSRMLSFVYSSFNVHMIIGIVLESVLMVVLLYVPGVNAVFGGRPLQFGLLGIPGLCFSMLLLGWQQVRKYMMNNDFWMHDSRWFKHNIFW